jgi:hypothetical protein
MESNLNTTDTKDSKVKAFPFVYLVSFVFNSLPYRTPTLPGQPAGTSCHDPTVHDTRS